MYFHQNNAALPLELYCIRAAAGIETQAELNDLLSAWRLCLQHGPSSSRRKIKKTAPPPPAPFTAESAAVPLRRIAALEQLLA